MTREIAINELQNNKQDYTYIISNDAIDMAIKALEQQPWETIKKIPKDYCYDTETKDFLVYRNKYTGHEIHIAHPTPQYRLEEEPILDKIRAEIDIKYGQCDICEYFEDYDYEENDISEYRPIGNIADILQIIDKYKAETENT